MMRSSTLAIVGRCHRLKLRSIKERVNNGAHSLSSVSKARIEELDETDQATPPHQIRWNPKRASKLRKKIADASLQTNNDRNDQHGRLLTEVTTKKGDSLNVKEGIAPSPSHAIFTGEASVPITSKLRIITPQDDTPQGVWPMFRIMDETGIFRDGTSDGYIEDGVSLPSSNNVEPKTGQNSSTAKTTPFDLDLLRTSLLSQYPVYKNEIEESFLLQPSPSEYPDTLSNNTLLRAHRHMMRLRQMDNILQNAQRQGRISFYMSCRGEEAIHIGSASALKLQDTVFAQYREAGLLMWRGFTLEQFSNQCFSNDLDLGRGRQMPVHYGSRALNYHTISSPLGTQLPQAVGAAYKLKLSALNRRMTNPDSAEEEGSVAVAFFGDGCASTTDFHSACNFAATLKAPVIFFCRNNGYAISTPVTEQYAGDGIVSRAPGYGMAGIRVDGNDIFAVHAAVRAARSYAIENSAPVLIEAKTYRQSHHSTSDDSTRYRSTEELHSFKNKSDPLKRFNAFLENQGWMENEDFASIRDEERIEVIKAMTSAEQRPHPKLETMFQDVYHDIPPHLERQQEQLLSHMKKYPGQY
uniref:2-oxoisovalerate dehydrogenase subunit alpha n=1 Tax=Attheya septentrionalis TaxID=420275 RepID=A0A7S2UAE3_9STRA|mmetsp:Transcript_14367/g.26110  ORF Transcript_14367/g.26110 Transcript_14367/m.26110 type:complete len:581 (+) Transcript_14367:103-1845(+)